MNQPDFLALFSFGDAGWGVALSRGAVMTVAVALCGFLVGGVIGVVGAWAKLAGGRMVRLLAEGYTTVLRGIPDLLVIYLFYFGGSSVLTGIGHLFGQGGFLGLPGFVAGALAVGVTSGAQQTEVLRAAYRAVNPGEIEAATACGMSRAMRFRRIIAPLSLRHALPGMGNVWQVVLKESALISVTGVVELLRESQIGAGSTGRAFDFYMVAGGLYLLISAGSSALLRRAELQVSRGVRRA